MEIVAQLTVDVDITKVLESTNPRRA